MSPTPIGIYAIIQELDNTVKNVGEWLSNDEPESAFPAAIHRRMRQHCDDWSRWPQWARDLPATAARATSDVCQLYLESNGSGDPVAETLFTGGQCPGVLYRTVNTTYLNGMSQTPVAFNGFETRGPVFARVDEDANFWYLRIGGRLLNGQPDVRTVTSTVKSQGSPPSWVSVAWQRVDGQPDNCGNPSPTIKPNPNPRPDPRIDPTYEDPDVTDPERPIIPIPPITDPFGRPFDFPDIFIDPWWSPSNVGAGGTPGNPNPGEPGAAEETGPGDVAEGEAPEGQRLTGVKVDVLSAPVNARRLQSVVDPPYIGACYVRMGYEDLLALAPAGQYLKSGDFFVAPTDSTHWRVEASLGYNLRVTPHYAQGEIENV